MSFNFVSSDCPARETEWPCPDPVQLSPEKIEQEKQRAEKKIFRNQHTKKILGSLEKIEIVYGYTVYVFSDGSRWRLDYYHKHIESIPLCGPYLSDYGINRKDKQKDLLQLRHIKQQMMCLNESQTKKQRVNPLFFVYYAPISLSCKYW